MKHFVINKARITYRYLNLKNNLSKYTNLVIPASNLYEMHTTMLYKIRLGTDNCKFHGT